MQPPPLDDNALLALIRDPATEQQGFNRLVRQYQQMLYGQIRRLVQDHDTTDDLLQQSFIKAWKKLDSFRGDSQLSTWLYRIATNEALSYLRKQKRQPIERIEDLPASEQPHETSAGASVSGEVTEQLLAEALAALPDRQRMVFLHRYYDEMPYAELSALLGVSEGSLKASYHHAVQKIKQYLAYHADDTLNA